MNENVPQIRRKRRKRKNNFGYLLLFLFVFFMALFGMLYAAKSFSPDVDVAIGNNESLVFDESELETETKTIDERLKWIQMEDDLPTVAVRTPREKFERKQEKQERPEYVSKPPISDKNNVELKNENKASSETNKQKLDFRLIKTAEPDNSKTVKIPKITKVYVGKYDTLEDAVKVQHKISASESEIVPFIKAINGKYVVQIGSFSDEERAELLVVKMKSKGYPARIYSEK